MLCRFAIEGVVSASPFGGFCAKGMSSLMLTMRLSSYVALQVATALFAIPAIEGLYFGPDFITVTRARAPDFSVAAICWEESLKDQIVAHLEDFCVKQELEQHVREAERLDYDSDIDDPTEALIVDILETQVHIQILLSYTILF
jgi:hypothetical protein